jgi:hypothetical protein
MDVYHFVTPPPPPLIFGIKQLHAISCVKYQKQVTYRQIILFKELSWHGRPVDPPRLSRGDESAAIRNTRAKGGAS